MTKKRKPNHVIWSNWDINEEDWQDFLDECYPDVTDDYEKWELINDMNYEYLEDERVAFKEIQKILDSHKNGYNDQFTTILAVANLGLWHGRRAAYRFFDSLEDILNTECGYAEWYYDGRQLRFRGAHHDGTNYYTYFLFSGNKEGCGNTDGEEKFLEDLYYGNPISKARWHKYTRSLRPYLKEYYGW